MTSNERADAARMVQPVELGKSMFAAGAARRLEGKPPRKGPAMGPHLADAASRVSVLLLALLVLMAGIVGLPTPSPAWAAGDWDVPNGHYFTQAAGPGEQGFAVLDQAGVNFWSEFNRLGGVNAVGYPVSERFQWNGFTCQAMQRVVFQWRPEIGQVYFVNVFDLMSQAGKDDWLLNARQTPKPTTFNEAGLSWDQIVNMRLAALDTNQAIKAAYYGVVGDPVVMNGLPTSAITDMGNNYTLRAQRVVIQQWKQNVPWASAGQVTFALGGSIAKEAGLLPIGAPGLPQSPAPTAVPPGATPSPTPTIPAVVIIPPTLLPICDPPSISSFTADFGSVPLGTQVKLSWGAVTNATSLTLEPGLGPVTAPGFRMVQPNQTTTYSLVAKGCTTTAAYVTVNIAAKPKLELVMEDILLSSSNEILIKVRTEPNTVQGYPFGYSIYVPFNNTFLGTIFTKGTEVAKKTDKLPNGSQVFWTGYKVNGTETITADLYAAGNSYEQIDPLAGDLGPGRRQMTKTCSNVSRLCK